MTRTTASAVRLGNVLPMVSPNGIRPTFSPSMNSIRPTMVASRPAVMIQESATFWRRMTSWNSTR